MQRIVLVFVLMLATGCSAYWMSPDNGVPPLPTEHRLDRDAEERNKRDRLAWFEHMHRTAPDVDWREIERANGKAEQLRRNRLGRAGATRDVDSNWTEIGSSNLAGRMHVAVIGPDGQTLYGGSSLGGVWRGNLDGTAWEPLGDNLWGGVHELLVLPPENVGEPDVIVATTDNGMLHVSRDDGLVWEEPAGVPDLNSIRGVALLRDAAHTILVYGRGPGTGLQPTILASTDYGRTFSVRWQSTLRWDGWMWVPRTGLLAGSHVYVLDWGRLRASVDGGFTFGTPYPIAGSGGRGVLTGSEAGAPTLYAAIRRAQWELYRSDDRGQTWTFVHTINDFWESLAASTVDPQLVMYGGVELFRSANGGASFGKVNHWWEYYGDIAYKLHADIPGLHVWRDPLNPAVENWYISTDGGIYLSEDGALTVQNISLDGLGVSQYYSTLSSTTNWDRFSAGAQDQGYQSGTVQHVSGDGPSTPLTQLTSGDYGHLTSSDGSHSLVVSTYPGFILVQDGPQDPPLRSIDFPADSLHAWLPPVVADPITPGTFYFCADRLWRYDRVSNDTWTGTVHSAEVFGGPAVSGNYLSAVAFAPTDPDRAYAVTDAGRLFYSTDHAETWTESTDSAPAQHYFYGNAISVHPDDPLEVAVGGSGYSAPGVIRSTDGGQSWQAEAVGLPPTLVYALVYARDGSGDLYAGTETGAYRWDRTTGLWENIMGNVAPTTIYWSAESVNDGGTVRFGTYGRGAWDYSIAPGDRDGDGVGDAVDSCANNDDPFQIDTDGDGLGDVCDNCVATSNAGQVDDDGDDAGNDCDCDPSNAAVFAIPGEVSQLRWNSVIDLEWQSALPTAGSATQHIVFRGELGDFPVGDAAPCTVSATQAYRLTDAGLPPVGDGWWYLVRGVNACGAGPLGDQSSGTPRDTPVCN